MAEAVPDIAYDPVVREFKIAPELDFHVGEVVQLKSGGPLMTIEEVPGAVHVAVTAIWFDGNTLCRGPFERRSITKNWRV